MENSTVANLRKEIRQSQPFTGVDTFLGRVAGGHTQTLLGHFLPTRKTDLGPTERIELEVSNGDRLIGYRYNVTTANKLGLVHIFHGLAGSSESEYMPRAAHAALTQGYDVVLWNHRGCGPGRGFAVEPYHSGRSDDLARAVKWGREMNADRRDYRHGVLGYSLSGNAACLLAAQVVPAMDTSPLTNEEFQRIGALPDFAIAINPPFDLKQAAQRLSRGTAKIYGQSFMPALLEFLDGAHASKNEEGHRRTMINLAAKARRKLSLLDNVSTFDAAYTGPAGGFQDHVDYYERASSGRYLHATKIPLIILSADDDPITNGFRDLSEAKVSFYDHPFVVIDRQAAGGHMGYVDRSTLISPWKQHSRWLEKRIRMYLRAFTPIFAGALFVATLSGCSLVDALKTGVGPSDFSQKEGILVPCPENPSCVSTQASRADQVIVPFTYSKPIEEARQALKEEMAKIADAKLIKEDGPYLHFECRSKVMRFIDDVEFLFDEETKTLQFRSASRFGYSDWGSNRKRMESIRNKILGRI